VGHSRLMPYKLLKEESNESPYSLKTLSRLPTQAISGAAAALPGSIGNIGEFLHETVANPVAKALGGEEVSYEKSPIGKLLPTTKTHLKNLEQIDYLKPKNKVEKFVRDLSQDTTELFLPGKMFKMGKYAFSPLRSLGISLGANTVGEGVGQFSGDESKGEMAKRGTMLGLSLLNPTSANHVAKNLYQTAERLLPPQAAVHAGKMTNSLNNLENKILRGRPAGNVSSSEKFVLDHISNFRNLIQNGHINMPQLVAQKRSFSEELGKKDFGGIALEFLDK